MILAEVGYGQHLVNPLLDGTGWSWVTAYYSTKAGYLNHDFVYTGTITFPDPGLFSYAYRFSLDNGASWALADLDGTNNGIDVYQLGVAIVLEGTGSPVPLPSAIWMFGAVCLGLLGLDENTNNHLSPGDI